MWRPRYLCWQQVIMRYCGSGEGGWPDLRRSGVKVLAGDGWYRKRTRMALVFKDHFSKIPPVAVPQAGIVTYILLNWPVHGVKVLKVSPSCLRSMCVPVRNRRLSGFTAWTKVSTCAWKMMTYRGANARSEYCKWCKNQKFYIYLNEQQNLWSCHVCFSGKSHWV